MAATQCDKIANVVHLFLFDLYLGRNHVNETTRHGIIAHRLWEENLGNITEVFVNDSFRFVARSLWFWCPTDIGYVSQLFLLTTMGNNTMSCGFVYVIAP